MNSFRLFLGLLLAVFPFVASVAAETLEGGFAQPPEQTKPWCYWYWLNGNISREGISRDLEAMARAGIGEALIGNIALKELPPGPVRILSEEWWGLIEHAIREGARTGVNIGLFNCPGWSQSGGPWVKPEQAMRYLVSGELRVTGPARVETRLPVPAENFQRVALAAFPAPAEDRADIAGRRPRVVATPAGTEAARLVDGDRSTGLELPPESLAADRLTVDLTLDAAMTARSLQLFPGRHTFGAQCELWAEPAGSAPVLVRKFVFDRSKPDPNVGPLPRGPVTVSFPAVTASRFQLRFTKFFTADEAETGKAELAEIELSGAARLEAFVEKQLGKMFQRPLPLWDAYLWKTQAEPEAGNLVVPAGEVRDLAANLDRDGVLRWEVPPGEWVILQTGMTPTGVKNAPAAPEAQGLEVDKMNRERAREHFDAFIGEVLRRLPPESRRAFTRVVADSYETGSENWTDGFGDVFQQRYGYEARPWLPVLTGRIVGSADESERFLWDLRRLVADRVATEYVGGMNEAARAHGLGLWLENYGHWGFPGEFLKYGAASDRIGGEYWVTGDLGSIECRAASSAANTYGKPFVSAEAFTGGPAFRNAPRALKARGDWSFCEGVNHLVLHVYIHQPGERPPGMNAWFGTEFNRFNTWFEDGRAWVDYVRRACWMLQQGSRVADVAYFIGEDAPKMTGVREPVLPPGHDFDYINADVIERDLAVRDGRLVLPHGTSYRLLVLPPWDTMRPAVLAKIRDLVRAGATVVGPAPRRSPSLQEFPVADAEVQRMARELWGEKMAAPAGEHKLGQGRVIWGRPLTAILSAMQVPADFEHRAPAAGAKLLYTHRRSSEADIYFVSNQLERDELAEVIFRTEGRQPELWDAVTGERRDLPQWRDEQGRTRLSLRFAPNQSWFVVFRRPAAAPAARQDNFPELVTVATLDGPWVATFDAAPGGPAVVTFPALADWSTQAQPWVRFYSGAAGYRKTFVLPESIGGGTGPLWLDLGEVRDLAVVRVNGRPVGTLWTAPWRIDVSQIAQAGENTVEIKVINPWHNRLAGDAAGPAKERITWLATETVPAGDALLPAGLLGPVTLQMPHQEAAVPEVAPDRFAAWMRPFWRGNRIEEESMLFIRNARSGEARAPVLFPPERVLKVGNSAGDVIYEEGRDYRWQPGSREIVMPAGSRIPAFQPEDLRRPAGTQPYQLTHRDGQGEILFGRGQTYAGMQAVITYTHAPGQWAGPPRGFAADILPRTITRLRDRQALSVVVLGDSISTGADASGVSRTAPFQPDYPELFRRNLAEHFQTTIALHNLSVGGKRADWGLTQIDRVVALRPQLVVIAFGMNDAGGRPAADYRSDIAGMIGGIRAKLPDTEFILVATMLGHPDWVALKPELFPAYRDALQSLCGPGIALADLTAVWTDFLARKTYADLTGNGVNHPNDFGHRVYAQVISALLIEDH